MKSNDVFCYYKGEALGIVYLFDFVVVVVQCKDLKIRANQAPFIPHSGKRIAI